MSESYDTINYLVDLRTDPSTYVTIIVVLIALLSIILRAWAQWGTERAWSTILIIAMVLLVFDAGLNLALIRYGFGGTVGTQLSFKQIVLLTKLIYTICVAYALILCFAKLTVLQMYLKIFEVHHTRIWIMLLAAVSVAACLANVLVVIFQCTPVRRGWLGTTSGKCIDVQSAFLGFAIVNMALDIIIPIAPAFGVAKLHADVGRRTLAIVMLTLGSLTVVASAYRLSLLVQPTAQTLPNPPGVRLTTWSTIEAAAAVTSSCLPLLKPLMRKLVVKFKSIRPGSQGQVSSGSSTAVNSLEDRIEPKNTSISNMHSIYSADSDTQVESKTV